MFTYGIDKVIPSQMPYPGVIDQMTPLGDFTRFDILWHFMGVAPGYMFLTGIMEIIGSLLLLNRRIVAARCTDREALSIAGTGKALFFICRAARVVSVGYLAFCYRG
jgi:hypothetical protein